ncbi:acyl carrier protein [bacterium]|jgi:acyl carrier protein|nr:acyl carrier protein [bacterium]
MALFDAENVKGDVVEIVKSKLSVDDDAVKDAVTFEDLGADSLDLVEIIMAIEEKYDIEVTDDEAERITSVEKAINLVVRKKN